MATLTSDDELVLEDEIGEVLLPTGAETEPENAPSFDDVLSDEQAPEALLNELVSEGSLADDFEELIAATAIEHALSDEGENEGANEDQADEAAKSHKAKLSEQAKPDDITHLIETIERLISTISNSHPSQTQQEIQNQFATGVHLAKNKQKPHLAARWFRKAALQGHAKAQFYLGVFFTKGEGLPKSYFHAYSWLSLAASQDLPEAMAARKQLESHLTAQETSAALKYAADLFEQLPPIN